jgi:hypothetical protein
MPYVLRIFVYYFHKTRRGPATFTYNSQAVSNKGNAQRNYATLLGSHVNPQQLDFPTIPRNIENIAFALGLLTTVLFKAHVIVHRVQTKATRYRRSRNP